MPFAWTGSVYSGLILDKVLQGILFLRLGLFVPTVVDEASGESGCNSFYS
jgi:hypothetical protein